MRIGFPAVTAAVTFGLVAPRASSHREAPLISQDPYADNTDVYSFVSPRNPDRVTLITNFIPIEAPQAGPNYYKFDDNVLYELMVDNDADAVEDVTFQFRFRTETRNLNTFLYNTGQVTSLEDTDLNVRQSYTVTRVEGPRRSGRATVLAENLPVAPVNVGVRSQSSRWVQVSRLGQPLVNELVIPRSTKDAFNALEPTGDSAALGFVQDPEPARLLTALFGVRVPPTPRTDLVTIFPRAYPGSTSRAGPQAGAERGFGCVRSSPDAGHCAPVPPPLPGGDL